MKWWTEDKRSEAAPRGFWLQPADSFPPRGVLPRGIALLCPALSLQSSWSDVKSASAAQD